MATRRQVSIFINGKQVANSIKNITTEKRKLSRELNHLVVGTQEYNDKVKEIRKLNGIISDHRKNLRGVTSTWGKITAGIGKFIAIAGLAFTADAIVDYGAKLFNLGAEMELLGKKAETVFAQALPQVTKAAKDNAAAMGLTISQYVGAAAAMGDLLIPMGFAREEAANISTELVNLSGALSEWTGGQIDAENVSRILSKALLGEREELKQLGIAINEADIKARLAEKGLSDLTGEMLQQAKAAATLELITEKSADAQAAFAENSDTLVRKQAELRAAFQTLQENIATFLIPVFHRLVDVANATINIFDSLSGGVKNITDSFDAQQQKVNDLETELVPLLDRYDELQTKSELTKEEQDELAKIIQRVGEITPSAISQIDEYGNVLSINADASREFLAAEKARLEFVNQDTIDSLEKLIQKLETQRDIQKEMAETGKSGGIISIGLSGKEIDKARNKVAGLTKEIQGAQAELARLRGDNLTGTTESQGDQTRSNRESEIKIDAEAEKRRKERDKKEAEDLQKRLQRQQEIIEKFEEKKAELLEQSLDKELEKAAEAEAEKNEKVIELELQRRQAQADIEAAIREELLSERELELFELEEHFTQLLQLANQFGLDTTELERAHRQAKADVQKKFLEEDKQRLIDQQKAEAEALAKSYSTAANVIGSFIDLVGEESTQAAGLSKVLTLAQIGFKSAEAIAAATASAAGVPFPGNLIAIATAVGTVLANIAQAKKILSSTKVPQKKAGGWLNAVGADDNVNYRVRYIGQAQSGMLPNHPVLMNTGAGPVIASERGAEYFVSNRDLQDPYVLDYVKAIDNIVKYRQFAEGGATAPLPGAGSSAAAAPIAASSQLMVVLNNLAGVLTRLEQNGVIAIIPDGTVVDISDRFAELNEASGGILG